MGGGRLLFVEMDESKGESRGEPHTLSVMPDLLYDLSISHDGQQLAATEREGSMNLTRLPLTAAGDAPAGPEEQLSRGDVFDRSPDVAPDSLSIAYCSNRLGLAELWVFHLNTHSFQRLQLPLLDRAIFGGTWFPDGRRLLVVVGDLSSGKRSLWTAAADGSQAAELFSPESMLATEGIPISPDGRYVVYPAKVEQYHQLFRLDVETRETRQITDSPGDNQPLLVARRTVDCLPVERQRRHSTLENSSGRGRTAPTDQRQRQNPARVLFLGRTLALLPTESYEHLPDAGRRRPGPAGYPLS
jgi:Tol biopolymer transport system component